MGRPPAIIEVVEATGVAAVPDRTVTEHERVVGQYAETSSVDGTGLWRTVELELEVGDNGTGAAQRVSQNGVVQEHLEGVGRVGFLLVVAKHGQS